MEDGQEVISWFYNDVLEEDTEPVEYLSLDPGGVHAYHVRPEPESITELAHMIDGSGVKRTLGSMSLRAFSRTPSLLPVLPYINETEFFVGMNTPPEIITEKSQIRLIARNSGVVHLVSLSADSKVRNVIEVRQKLPPSINTPALVAHDASVPYLTEEYIHGRLAGDPGPNNVDVYADVFGQLSTLYKSTTREQIDAKRTSKLLINQLERSPIETKQIRTAHEVVDDLDHPEFFTRCRIHGDINGRNVIVSEKNIYLIDWESSRIDFPMYDLFRPLLIQYFDTADPKPVIEAIQVPNRSEYAAAFARNAGPAVYNQRHWFPLTMLLGAIQCLCNLENQSPLWKRTREIFYIILDQLK